jgi:hypothetical protein
MAFLTYSDGTTNLTLDVSMTSAAERVPDRIGAATRAFSGVWRSDEQEFRTWDFTHPLMAQADYVTLRNMVKCGTQITVKGDAVESPAGFVAIVRINSAAISDDGRAGLGGWARDVQVTIQAGAAS